MNIITKIANIIRQKKSFIICGHLNPDGDVIGSSFALYRILKALDKDVLIAFDPPAVPKKYNLRLPKVKILPAADIGEIDTLIALECPMPKRLGNLKDKALGAKTLINIDHHQDNAMYGHLNVVFPNAAATTEIIYKIAVEMGARITPEIATHLYMGLVTDTGRFQYSNTNADTLKLAARLVEAGAEPAEVFQQVYENTSYAALLQLGMLAANSMIEDNILIWSYIDKKKVSLPADPGDTENLIDHLRAVSGPEVAMLIKIDNGESKVSLRSKGVINVAKIAETMGGGGHPNAAGFSCKLPLEKIVEKIRKEIRENKK